MYLYDMSCRLFNVRLDDERVRKVQALREGGMTLSDVVRNAIDEQFATLRGPAPGDVQAMVERMFDQHPDPAGLPARGYDVHDRRAARRAIEARLRRGRP